MLQIILWAPYGFALVNPIRTALDVGTAIPGIKRGTGGKVCFGLAAPGIGLATSAAIIAPAGGAFGGLCSLSLAKVSGAKGRKVAGGGFTGGLANMASA